MRAQVVSLPAVLVVAAALFVATTLAGCQKDQRGNASLRVQTTLPAGVPITLVSVDRPGTYVERSRTDIGGFVSYIGIQPGKYKLVYQFSAPDVVPTNPAYNYGETDPFEVRPGNNMFQWTAGTSTITRGK